MTITIDLLRHGDVAGGTKLLGHSDEPLSELGWQQLRSVVDGITPPWTKIISSPLQRCHAFAEELSDRFDLPLTVDQHFREISFGKWDGLSFAELYESPDADRLLRFWQNPSENPAPGGEAYDEFEQRVFSAWQPLLENVDDDQHYLLVAHGGVIRTILRYVLAFPTEHFFRLDVPYACLTRIRAETPDYPRLLFLGGNLGG